MEEKILVTGGTGNVGSEVIKGLFGKGQIVAAVRDIDKAREILGDRIDYVSFDFEKPETFASAFQGVSKVFLVRPPAISNVKKYISPAIETAKARGVEHIVFLSLMGVDRNKFVPHYKIERAIASAGIPATFLRASFFMQNLNTTHCLDIKEHNEIFLPAGNGKTSFIDVRDIAAVAVKALTESGHQNKAYTLTGSEALDYYQIAEIFTSVLGRKILYSNPSLLNFWWRMRSRGFPLPFILVMMGIYTTAKLGLAGTVTPETEQLLQRPPITVRQYVENYQTCWS